MVCNVTTSLTPHKIFSKVCIAHFCFVHVDLLKKSKRCWVLHPGYCCRVVQKFRVDLSFGVIKSTSHGCWMMQIQHGLWSPTSSVTNRPFSLGPSNSFSEFVSLCKWDRTVVSTCKELWSGFIEISKWSNTPRAWVLTTVYYHYPYHYQSKEGGRERRTKEGRKEGRQQLVLGLLTVGPLTVLFLFGNPWPL